MFKCLLTNSIFILHYTYNWMIDREFLKQHVFASRIFLLILTRSNFNSAWPNYQHQKNTNQWLCKATGKCSTENKHFNKKHWIGDPERCHNQLNLIVLLYSIIIFSTLLYHTLNNTMLYSFLLFYTSLLYCIFFYFLLHFSLLYSTLL